MRKAFSLYPFGVKEGPGLDSGFLGRPIMDSGYLEPSMDSGFLGRPSMDRVTWGPPRLDSGFLGRPSMDCDTRIPPGLDSGILGLSRVGFSLPAASKHGFWLPCALQTWIFSFLGPSKVVFCFPGASKHGLQLPGAFHRARFWLSGSFHVCIFVSWGFQAWSLDFQGWLLVS